MRNDPPTWTPERRLQRREFKDFQPLFMLVNSLDIIDEPTRRDFVCLNGPVWKRYNETTRRSRQRRITVLFLSDEYNLFDTMLYVGCDCLKGREHRCRTLWTHPDWRVDDTTARQLCIDLQGRSVLRPASVPGLVPVDAGPLPSFRPRPASRGDHHAVLAA